MQRNDWKFHYSASTLASVAQQKLDFHEERMTFWKSKKAGVINLIRSEGIEVDEKIVLGFRSPKERDWERGAKVMVRNDLQRELEECMEKLGYHAGKIRDYAGWQQVLSANHEDKLDLDIEDWLFFFDQR